MIIDEHKCFFCLEWLLHAQRMVTYPNFSDWADKLVKNKQRDEISTFFFKEQAHAEKYFQSIHKDYYEPMSPCNPKDYRGFDMCEATPTAEAYQALGYKWEEYSSMLHYPDIIAELISIKADVGNPRLREGVKRYIESL